MSTITPSYLWNLSTSLHPCLSPHPLSRSPPPGSPQRLFSYLIFHSSLLSFSRYPPPVATHSFIQQKFIDCKWLFTPDCVPSLVSIFYHSAFHLSLPHLPEPHRTSFGSFGFSLLLAIIIVGLCLEHSSPFSVAPLCSSSRKISSFHQPLPRFS